MTQKRIPAKFYQNENGKEPVRNWLKDLEPEKRALIGSDIKTVEFGWPIGMPTKIMLRAFGFYPRGES